MVVVTVIEFLEGCTKSMNEQIAFGDIPLQAASAAGKIGVKARLSEALPMPAEAQVADLLDLLWSLGTFQVKRGQETGLVMYRVPLSLDMAYSLRIHMPLQYCVDESSENPDNPGLDPIDDISIKSSVTRSMYA